VLSPDYQGTDDSLLRGVPDGSPAIGGPEKSNDPIHEFLKTHTVQVLKPQMATGAKAFYNRLDGSVR